MQVRTSLNMSVARAAIFDKVKALPPKEKELGVIPNIMKLIDEDDGETANYAIAQLLKNREELEANLEKATQEKKDLEAKQEKLNNKITELQLDNDNLHKEIDIQKAESKHQMQSRATAEAQLSETRKDLENTKNELTEEKKLHADKVQELNAEISRVTLKATDNDYVKMAKVLTAVLIYCEQARAVNQNELIDFFLEVHKWGKENAKTRYDTKLRQSTVERVFSEARKISKKNGLNQNWFSEPNIIKVMIDRHHPPRLASPTIPRTYTQSTKSSKIKS